MPRIRNQKSWKPATESNLAAGRRCRIKSSVTDPYFGWGYISVKGEEGLIKDPVIKPVSYYANGGFSITFPSQEEWYAIPEEIEIFC